MGKQRLWTYHIIWQCTESLNMYHNRNIFQKKTCEWVVPEFLCQCSEVILDLLERASKFFLCLQFFTDCSPHVHVPYGSHKFSCYSPAWNVCLLFSCLWTKPDSSLIPPNSHMFVFCSSFAKLILNSTVVAGSQTSQLLLLPYLTSPLP